MRFFEKLDIFKKVLKGVTFSKRFPLAIMWSLTYRCNLDCKYCGVKGCNKDELDTRSILSLIKEAHEMGVKFIDFSGGEVLLRDDLSEIISVCKNYGMRVLINSNGTLVKKYFYKIKDIDEIKISLDGTKKVNDFLRGDGVHDKVLEALEICKSNNINVLINSVMSKHSISSTPYTLGISKKFNVGIYFHPVSQTLSHNSDQDIHSAFGPDDAEYKKMISLLIEEKKCGNELIKNSIAGLKHLYNYPNPHNIGCIIKLFFLVIEPDGKIFICDCFPNYQQYLRPIEKNLKTTYDKLFLPNKCKDCWSGSLPDINLFKTPSVDNALNLWKRFVKMVK